MSDSLNKEYSLLQKKSLELDKEVTNLTNAISSKDSYIRALSDEKVSALKENDILKSQLSQKDLDINLLKTESQSKQNMLQDIINAQKDALNQKDEEINDLKTKFDEYSKTPNVDLLLVKDLEKTKLINESLKKEFLLKDEQLLELRSRVNTITYINNQLKQENENLKQLFLNEQNEKNRLKQELDSLNHKTQAAFTPFQLSNYLTNAIDLFNKDVNTSSSSVDYIISDMDVELKASLSKNDRNEMIMAAPDLGLQTENSLSSIKFSIRAVPKNIDSK